MTVTPTLISSPHNELFRQLLQLRDRKGISKYGSALISGKKFVSETFARHRDLIEAVVVPDGFNLNDLVPYRNAGISMVTLSVPLFRELDEFGTNAAIVKIKCPPLPVIPSHLPADVPLAVLLPFQHPDNIGAALRSCSAFGVNKVVLAQEAAHPFHPKSLRVAGPSVLDLTLQRAPAFASLTADPQLNVYVFDAAGTPLPSVTMKSPALIVCGLEGPGVGKVFAGAQRIAIPMRDGVESLNAAQSLTIALYHHYTKSGV